MRYLSILLILMIAVSLPELAMAQKANGTSTEKAPNGTRKQLSIIVFAGISGAILGLSTLSFYGRPQDKLNNIWGGFAVGIIVGAIYSAYSVTTQPRQFSRGAENDRDNEWWRNRLRPVSQGAQIWDEEQWQHDHPRFAGNADPIQFGYAFHF